MRTRILSAATIATVLLGTAAVEARGDISHILGDEGPQVQLDAMCHRAVVAPPGETVEMDVNVLGQQVHCLIRRPDPFARCVRHLGPAPTVKLVRKDDWTNVDKVAAYQAAIYECSKARL